MGQSSAAFHDLWYEERGSGEPLVLLHPGGAGVDSRALAPQVSAFAGRFHLYIPEQRGHGRTPDADGPLGFDQMADDTVRFLEQVVGRPAALFGCSDGATLALVIALRRPDLVTRLVFAAGVFHHDGWHDGVLEGEPPEFLRDSYAELSPDGADHYPVVVAKLAAMHAEEPALKASDLRGLQARTLVLIADDDEVRFEHAVDMLRNVPNAELAVIPGTSHGLLVEKPDLCNWIVEQFLTTEPSPTFAPVRRKDSTS
jgi:pimeloyl-ACP methyl ester carboxylesterase